MTQNLCAVRTFFSHGAVETTDYTDDTDKISLPRVIRG